MNSINIIPNRLKYLILFLISFFISANFLQAQTYLISQGGTISTCSGKIYDSGGQYGNYSSNENFTVSIQNPNANGIVRLHFVKFLTARYDILRIYDGPNTSSPLIISAEYSVIEGMTFASTGAIITLNFVSDGSDNKLGFEANISCGYPCQNYSFDIESSTPDLLYGDVDSIHICPNSPLQITANADFTNNNFTYQQTLENLTWTWKIASEHGIEETVSTGAYEYNHPGFDIPGVYYLDISCLDINECASEEQKRIKLYVSNPPNFDGTFLDPPEICLGQEVDLVGNVNPTPWQYVFPITNNDTICFTDGFYQQRQVAPFNYTVFEPGQIITDARNQIDLVCVTFEHSYLGDLSMYLECPNANLETGAGVVTFIKYPNGCGSTYLGVPISDAPGYTNPVTCPPEPYANIGIMSEYCWSTDPEGITMASACSYVSTLIPTTYAAENNSFENLNGCPLNGTWNFVIVDDLRRDDGALGSVTIQFSESIMPPQSNYEHFTNVYDLSPESTTAYWTGNGVVNEFGPINTAIPTEVGTHDYTFTAIDDFACPYDTVLSVIVYHPGSEGCCLLPTPELGPDLDVCEDNCTFSYEMPEENSGTWSLVSGPGTASWSSETDPSASVTVSEPGEYVFAWTEFYFENETCFGTAEIEVNFWPIPTSEFSFSPIGCFGDTINIVYTGNLSSSADFSWNFSGGQIVSGSGIGPYQVTWDTPGNHNISLSVSEHGCHSLETINVIFSPEEMQTQLEAFDNNCFNACDGYAIATVIGGSLPYSYQWASGVEVAEGLCAGTYELTVNDANNCSTINSFTINEPPELIVDSVMITNLRCFDDNSDGKVELHLIGGTTPYEYIWSDGGASSSSRINLDAGNYFVTVKDANQCIVVIPIVITQPEELIVDIFPQFEICEGQPTSLSANANGGVEPYIYYWDQGDDFVAGAANISVNLSETTYFNVYVKDANDCKSNTISSTLIVSPKMNIDNIETKDNNCYHSCDGRAEISISGGLPPFTYSWNSTNNILENICAGTYNLSVVDKIGCKVSGNFIIEEPTKLILESNIEDASCSNSDDGQITVFAQGGIPEYTYLWPNGNNTASLTANAGEYTVTVIDKNDCRRVETYTINAPEPILIMPISDNKICKGQSIDLQAVVIGGNQDYTYQWVGDDGSMYGSNPIVLSPEVSTDYQLVVTDAEACSSDPLLFRIIVFPELKILKIVSDKNEICPGQFAEVFVSVEGGNGGPYQITLEDGSVVSSPFKLWPDESRLYTIKVEDLCSSAPVFGSIKIDLIPEPDIAFMASVLSGCVPLEVEFYESTPIDRSSYLWDFGDNNFGIEKSLIHTYEKPGVYTVSLDVVDMWGCKNTKYIQDLIRVYQRPTAQFQMSSEAVSFLSPNVSFNNLSVNARTYKWYFGDGDSSININPVHFYPNIGEYEVVLVAESDDKCLDTIKSKLKVDNQMTFYMPTSFSPNGDGLNDYVRPCGNGISIDDFDFRVYDRWGNVVFKTKIYNPEVACDSGEDGAWDGSLKSNTNTSAKLPNGVYYWICEFKDWTGTAFSKSGSIGLIR